MKASPNNNNAGLLGMKSTDWEENAADMDTLFPGNDYVGKLRS